MGQSCMRDEALRLTKKSIQALNAYKHNSYSMNATTIKLDANESNQFLFNDGLTIETEAINVYPDHYASNLRQAISQYIGVPKDFLIAGNGSSEMIELLFKIYVDKDEVVFSFHPSFSMYRVYSQIFSSQLVETMAEDDFSMNVDHMIENLKLYNPKLIFICTPNNPTGALVKKSEIIRLLEHTDAIVVVDEAYMEFADEGESMVREVNKYNNLVVLRTLSKAFGLAAIRIGYMITNKSIIDIANRVKSPYNLNALSQHVAIRALNQSERMNVHVRGVLGRRDELYVKMKQLGICAYPSHGNFIFFRYDDEILYKSLINKGILIRQFSGTLKNHYRVSIGSEWENKQFLDCVEEVIKSERI